MIAIISDIHGNYEALQAVLADIDKHPVSDVYCLGDVVGYGPNPLECIDAVRRCKLVLLGNHDHAALFDPASFSPVAERAIFWTRGQLESPDVDRLTRLSRWEFLAGWQRTHREDPYLFVHGSARNPLNEYVFPDDIYNHGKIERVFAAVPRYCFQGHTHMPGVFLEQTGRDRYVFRHPEELKYTHRLDERKTLVNVGSVGQPRDLDPRACYVLLDGDTVRYRRVEYDIDAVAAKIYAVPELDNVLGDRLRAGR